MTAPDCTPPAFPPFKSADPINQLRYPRALFPTSFRRFFAALPWRSVALFHKVFYSSSHDRSLYLLRVCLVPDGFLHFHHSAASFASIIRCWPVCTFRGLHEMSIKSSHLLNPNLRGSLVPILLIHDGSPWAQSPRVSRFHHSLSLSLSLSCPTSDHSPQSLGHLRLPLSL